MHEEMNMTPKLDDKVAAQIMEVLLRDGTAGFGEVFKTLLNQVMKEERSAFLNARPYERTETRKGYSNGYKPKTLNTRLGVLQIEIPQVRGLKFYPQSLERGSRSERALKLAIAEMYVNGVSTRRVTEITEQLCGLEISSTQVSRLSKVLDEEIEKFRNRKLGKFPYIYLDAHYQKIRHNGFVRDFAILVAIGIDPEGKRHVLGISASLSEAEVHWREFLQSLGTRGLHGVEFIVSDDHKGLRAARMAVFPGVLWQRCQFHFQQNAQQFASSKEMRKEIAWDIRDVFNASSLEDAQRKKDELIKKYDGRCPKFAKWIELSIEECFPVFSLPREYWVKLRTVNPLENLNREIRRRTNLAAIFPNTDSAIRLITAVLIEVHEEWISDDNYYLNMEHKKHEKQKNNFKIYRKKLLSPGNDLLCLRSLRAGRLPACLPAGRQTAGRNGRRRARRRIGQSGQASHPIRLTKAACHSSCSSLRPVTVRRYAGPPRRVIGLSRFRRGKPNHTLFARTVYECKASQTSQLDANATANAVRVVRCRSGGEPSGSSITGRWVGGITPSAEADPVGSRS